MVRCSAVLGLILFRTNKFHNSHVKLFRSKRPVIKDLDKQSESSWVIIDELDRGCVNGANCKLSEVLDGERGTSENLLRSWWKLRCGESLSQIFWEVPIVGGTGDGVDCRGFDCVETEL